MSDEPEQVAGSFGTRHRLNRTSAPAPYRAFTFLFLVRFEPHPTTTRPTMKFSADPAGAAWVNGSPVNHPAAGAIGPSSQHRETDVRSTECPRGRRLNPSMNRREEAGELWDRSECVG